MTDAPAQGHDNDSACPLSLPLLNLVASLCVQQDEDNGKVAVCLLLPPQRKVTKHIMQTWMIHEETLRNPSTDRMCDVHMLHHPQSVSMLDETSAAWQYATTQRHGGWQADDVVYWYLIQ